MTRIWLKRCNLLLLWFTFLLYFVTGLLLIRGLSYDRHWRNLQLFLKLQRWRLLVVPLLSSWITARLYLFEYLNLCLLTFCIFRNNLRRFGVTSATALWRILVYNVIVFNFIKHRCPASSEEQIFFVVSPLAFPDASWLGLLSDHIYHWVVHNVVSTFEGIFFLLFILNFRQQVVHLV